MQELLCSLRVIHDNESFIQGVYAKAGDAAPKIADGLREHYPPVEHPMVRTHPETGRRSIVFAWRFMNRIVGFSEHESKSLLTFIGEWVKGAVPCALAMGAGRPRHLGRTLDTASGIGRPLAAEAGYPSTRDRWRPAVLRPRCRADLPLEVPAVHVLNQRSRSPQGVCGGGRGIRTPGPVKARWFQDQCNRPLCHPSGDEATASRTKPHSSVATSMRLWCQSRAAMRAVPARSVSSPAVRAWAG